MPCSQYLKLSCEQIVFYNSFDTRIKKSYIMLLSCFVAYENYKILLDLIFKLLMKIQQTRNKIEIVFPIYLINDDQEIMNNYR